MFETGIKLQGEKITALRFTNNVCLAESEVNLGKMLNSIEILLK